MRFIKSTLLDIASSARVLGFALTQKRSPPLILMYHGVTNQRVAGGLWDHDGKHFPLDLFIGHLRVLKRARKVIALNQLVEGLYNGEDLRNTVAITFDDGYENNVSVAAPALADFDMSATFFLVSGLIGTEKFIWPDLLEMALQSTPRNLILLPGKKQVMPLRSQQQKEQALVAIKAILKNSVDESPDQAVEKIALSLGVHERVACGDYRFMNWQQARSLVSGGFDVGAHTVTHPILSKIPFVSAIREIIESRDVVQREAGRCSATFCFPNGKLDDYNARLRDFCRMHFKAALSTNGGAASLGNIYDLKRLSPAGRGKGENIEWSLFRAN